MTTERSGSGDVHRSMQLLWNMRERPTRGPKPGLSLEKIVTAAIELADVDGLEALSMRAVAAKLGVGTMSLYRYIPSKGELLDLMLDRVAVLPDDLPDTSQLSPRQLLEQMARGLWQLSMDHPWYPFVDQARPIIGPNGLANVEYVAGPLHKTGMTDQEMVLVIFTVEHFTAAAARTQISTMQAEQRTGVSNEEFWAAQEPALVEAIESGRYPTMARLAEDSFSFTAEGVFEFGLQRLLDGLEPFIESRDAAAG